MKLKEMETKHVVGLIIVAAAAVAAAITAAVIIFKRKKKKKYYVECSDEAIALEAALDEEAEEII